MDQPLVSIIIPCFNAAKTLGASIESCLCQEYDTLEVIVVDDHSTDESLAVVEAFAREDVRIRVFSNPSKGVSLARNFGLSKAKGSFVKFLDSDDLISPDIVRAQVDLLQHRAMAVAHCSWAHFLLEAGDLPIIRQSMDQDYSDSGRLLAELWLQGMYPLHAWMVPRQLLTEDIRWDDSLTQNQDGEFFARVLSKAQGVYYSSGTAFYRKPQRSNVSQQTGGVHMHSQLRVLQSYREVCKELGDTPTLLKGYDYQVCAVAYRASTTLEEMPWLKKILEYLEADDHIDVFPSRVMNLVSRLVGLHRAFVFRSFITILQNSIGASSVPNSEQKKLVAE